MATIKYWATKQEYGPMKYLSGPNLVDIKGYLGGFLIPIGTRLYFTGGQNESLTSGFWNKNVYYSDDLGSTWTDDGNTGSADPEMFMFQAWADGTDLFATIIDIAPALHIYIKTWNTALSQWDTIATDPWGAGVLTTVNYMSNADFVGIGDITINASLNIQTQSDTVWTSADLGVNWTDNGPGDPALSGYGGKLVENGIYTYLLHTNRDSVAVRTDATETTPIVFYNDDNTDWTVWKYLTTLSAMSTLTQWDSQVIENSEGESILCLYSGKNPDKTINPYIYQYLLNPTVINIFDVETITTTTEDYVVDESGEYVVDEEGSLIVVDTYPGSDHNRKTSEFYRNTEFWRAGSCFFQGCWYLANGAKDGNNASYNNYISIVRFKDVNIKLTKQEQYVEKIAARLLSQYENSTNLKNLIDVYISDPAQSLEDLFFRLYYLIDIDLELGKQLDFIGNIIGLPRSGMMDWEYRLMIKAKIIANTCDGSHGNFINAWVWLTQDEDSYYINDFPAKIDLRSKGLLPGTLLAKIKAYMELALSAGVGISGLTVVV